MRQQLPHRNVLFSVLRKLGQIFRHRIVQPHLALFHQLHHSRCGRNHLGQRRQIKNRIQRHRFAPRLQRPIPISLAVDHLPVVTDHEDRPGNLSLMNSLLDDGVHRAQTRRGHGTLSIYHSLCRSVSNNKGKRNHQDDAPARDQPE